MPTFKEDHEGNSFKVCVICLEKSKGFKLLLDDEDYTILKNLPKYTTIFDNKDHLARGICEACKRILSTLDTTKPRSLPNVDYKGLIENVLKNLHDESSGSCNCELCKIGRHKGSKKFESEFVLKSKNKRGRIVTSEDHNLDTSKEKSPEQQARVRCPNCYGIYALGTHKECGQDKKLDNLMGMMSPKTKEQIVARVLDEKFKEADEAKKATINLSRRFGSKMTVTTPKAAAAAATAPQLSEKFFLEVKKTFGTSGRNLRELARLYREMTGGSVVPHLREKLQAANHTLDDFFEVNVMTFLCEDKEENEYFDFVEREDGGLICVETPDGRRTPRARYTVVCKDVLALINFLKEKRHITNDTIVKIGIDGKKEFNVKFLTLIECFSTGGQGFLKVALILQEENTENVSTDKKKKSHKGGGVRKLLVLFIGEQIPESYANVKKILEVLNIFDAGMIDKVSFASDLKLINIMVGMQSHSCIHACAWCECPTRGETAYIDQDQYSLRTLGRMKKQAEKFHADGSKLLKAKDYCNVINVPLLRGLPDTTILELIPPPGNSQHYFNLLHT